MNGAIVVDKPQGWTSHDVVNRMRRIAGTRKIGHLGTLDPLATGVLPLLLDRATRMAQFFTLNEKEYLGTIRFGYSTDSYDADGEPTSPYSEPIVDLERLETILPKFRGALEQTPPPVSAKKIQGRPAYEFARKHIAVELKPVSVTVHELVLLKLEGCRASVRVRCSAGTYIRSLTHEIGIEMGCGAYLETLRRTMSGPFCVSQSRSLEDLAAMAEAQRLEESLIPAAQLLPEFPLEVVDQLTEGQIRQGRDFRVSPFRSRGSAKYVKAVSREGELVAIGEIRLPNLYHPVLVL
jgi:tRNA pseudouridine55 synthase